MKYRQALHTMAVILTVYLIILIATFVRFRSEPFPKPTWETISSGIWSEEVEEYLERNLGFRDIMYRARGQSGLVVGEKMIQDVYITKQMLLEKLPPDNTMDGEALAEPVNRFYSVSGIPTFVVLVPSASTIYARNLPANAAITDQKKEIGQVYENMQNGIRCVDAVSVLSPIKDSYIYYRTDSHWTCYGAYNVYQAAIRKMGFSPVPYNRYVISHLSTDFRGDLYQKTLHDAVKSDVLDQYSDDSATWRITGIEAVYADGRVESRGKQLYHPSALESEHMYYYYLGSPCQKLTIRTSVDNGKKLLLYKDDYADCMVPFLLHHYSEICIINLEQTGSYFASAQDYEGYSQALFLCSMKRWKTIMDES